MQRPRVESLAPNLPPKKEEKSSPTLLGGSRTCSAALHPKMWLMRTDLLQMWPKPQGSQMTMLSSMTTL